MCSVSKNLIERHSYKQSLLTSWDLRHEEASGPNLPRTWCRIFLVSFLPRKILPTLKPIIKFHHYINPTTIFPHSQIKPKETTSTLKHHKKCNIFRSITARTNSNGHWSSWDEIPLCFEGSLSMSEMDKHRRLYHKNCSCALHRPKDETPKACNHHTRISYTKNQSMKQMFIIHNCHTNCKEIIRSN